MGGIFTHRLGAFTQESTAGVVIDGYTKLRQTSAQSIPNGTVNYTTVTWGAEDHDNLGAFDSGTSTSNIVVPSGITLMRAQLKSAWGNVTDTRRIRLWDATNSVAYLGDMRTAANEAGSAIDSGWLTVTPGITLRLEVMHGNASSMDYGNAGFGGLAELTLGWASAFSVLHG